MILLLALGWLLPNHYPPWNTFHSNAWVGGGLLVLGFWRLVGIPTNLRISAASSFLFGCAAIPWLQHASGLIALPSAALLGSLYLVGLAAAFALGENDSRNNPGDLAGLILVAASIASLVSVGLQIFQWLGHAQDIDLENAWIFPAGPNRPVANLGQPNLLASLLLWGVLGVCWAWHRTWINRFTATVFAGFILFGVALTESRTALLILTIGVAVLLIWRPAFIGRRLAGWSVGLYAWYAACLFGHAAFGRLLGLSATSTFIERSAGESRFALWRMALDAISQRPWLGYGWDEFNEGFLEVFPRHPAFTNLYAERSHNLVLDLVAWVGWPIGVALMLCVAVWAFKLARSVACTARLLQVAALGVMLIHAMLEMPLHHGYFLWPFGVIAGSASAGLGLRVLGVASRKVAFAGMGGLALAVAAIVHDYLNIEAAFAELRFQLQHIGRNHDERPPRTLVLTDWQAYLAMSRTVPEPGMSEVEIKKWEDLLLYNTSALAFRKVVGALAVNGRPDEAAYWAERYCAVMHPKFCKNIWTEWGLEPRPAGL